jgi:hypothetical protein
MLEQDQQKHLETMQEIVPLMMRKKYESGADEHKTKLWELPGQIDMALDEVIDLIHYLMTLKGHINDFDRVLRESIAEAKKNNSPSADILEELYNKFKVISNKPKQ